MINYIPEPNEEGFMYFKRSEFKCKETGKNCIDDDFIMRLDNLRYMCGFPFVITSGYRSPEHSVEKKKATPGTHAQGIAADIAVSSGTQRAKIVEEALKLGFTGIGVAKGFVHVDVRDSEQPVLWVY